jgi:type II secretory pathway pseudopilin PulG
MKLAHSPNCEGVAGFTMIEAVVTLALMGFILAALATITAQWLPNWNHGVGRVQAEEKLALGLERATADLAAAEFIPVSVKARQVFFDGTDRSATFVRTAMGPNAGPGLEVIRIAEVNNSSGWNLGVARLLATAIAASKRRPIDIAGRCHPTKAIRLDGHACSRGVTAGLRRCNVGRRLSQRL